MIDAPLNLSDSNLGISRMIHSTLYRDSIPTTILFKQNNPHNRNSLPSPTNLT